METQDRERRVGGRMYAEDLGIRELRGREQLLAVLRCKPRTVPRCAATPEARMPACKSVAMTTLPSRLLKPHFSTK